MKLKIAAFCTAMSLAALCAQGNGVHYKDLKSTDGMGVQNGPLIVDGSVTVGERMLGTAEGTNTLTVGQFVAATNNGGFASGDGRTVLMYRTIYKNSENPIDGNNYEFYLSLQAYDKWIYHATRYPSLFEMRMSTGTGSTDYKNLAFFSIIVTNYLIRGDKLYFNTPDGDKITSGAARHVLVIRPSFASENASASGISTFAGDTGSHAEGIGTMASASYSHAEGENTVAYNTDAHAEGQNTAALGLGSHAEGAGVVAAGSYSHAEGNGGGYYVILITFTTGSTNVFTTYHNPNSQLRPGNYISALSKAYFTATRPARITGVTTNNGLYTVTLDKSVLSSGYPGETNNVAFLFSHGAMGLVSHSAGRNSVAADDYSYVWSGTTNTYESHGPGSYSIDPQGGGTNVFIGEESLDQFIAGVADDFYLPLSGGVLTGNLSITATNWRSGKLSYGFNATNTGIYGFAGGENVTASGQNSFSSGYFTEATAYGSRATGGRSKATASYAQAAGLRATASNTAAYVWQGADGGEYGSHGDRTWNINPEGGLSGTYVGETNLVGHITAIARAALRGDPLDALQDETFNGMESAGLTYVTNSTGVWVSGFGGLDTAVVPKYRKDGTEIAGILANANGADSLTEVYIGADCIEVLDTIIDDSTVSESAFTALPDLAIVIWSGKNARFVGDIERHMFRVATSSDERDAGSAEGALFKLGPFASCSNLSTFISPYLKDVPAKCFISAASLWNCKIPSVRTIGEMAFAYSALEEFEAAWLQKIHTSAFKNCEVLGRVTISSKVEIGSQAFMGCGMLSDLTIDNALSIGARAFYGCTNLAGPYTCLLRYVESVGEEAFMADKKGDPWLVPFSNVRRFELPRAKTVLSIPRDTANLRIGKATKVPRWMEPYTNLEHICVNSLKEIPDEWAVRHGAEWHGLPKLRRVCARNVKTVGNSAFYMCTNLDYISMSGAEKIGHSAFLGTDCSHFHQFRKLRQIGNFAFAGSKIKNANGDAFPKLEIVGDYAFIGCQQLSAVWLPAARHVGHNLCGSCGTSPKFYFGPSTNVMAIVLDSALDIGGSVGANCPNLEVFSAKSCIRMGGHMIDNTRCHTSDARQGPAEKTEGLSFPALQRCGSHAFAYVTNATSFYAPNLADVSTGSTWIEGAWTNIYVPALTYYDESMVLGSDNLMTITWASTLPLGEVWSFDLEDGTTVEKTVGIVRDSGELLDRIRQLEWDTSEYYCMWTTGSSSSHPVSMTQTNWIPTNWPARHVTIEVRGLGPTNETAAIAIRKGWTPPRDCWLTIQSAGVGGKRIQLGDVAFNEGELKHGQKARYDIWWNSRMNMWIPTRTTLANYINSLNTNGAIAVFYDCDEFPPIHDLPE